MRERHLLPLQMLSRSCDEKLQLQAPMHYHALRPLVLAAVCGTKANIVQHKHADARCISVPHNMHNSDGAPQL